MEVFSYRAVDERGRVRRGRTEAQNLADLEQRLARRGLELISGQSRRKTGGEHGSAAGLQRVELITFCFHLEQLLRAGVPILEGLADLRDTVGHRGLREIASSLIQSIEGGRNLSGALAEFPGVFDPVMVSLVRAGEQSGRLTQVLERLIENLKWQDEQAALTRRLLLYPALVAGVLTGTLGFLLLYVVPQLLDFLTRMGQPLPLETRLLIGLAQALSGGWYWIALAVAAGVAGSVLAYRHEPRFALAWDRWQLRLPMVGPVLQKIIISRVCTVFAIMYAAGITVLDCLRASESVAGNRAVAGALREAARLIADGGAISTSFGATGYFPPLVLRMLRVGENAGALEEALANVSYFFTRDVRESVNRLQTLMMPLMVVILGLFMLWIVAAVFGPLYDLFTHIRL